MLETVVKICFFLIIVTGTGMEEKVGNVPEITDFLLVRCHHGGAMCMLDIARLCLDHLRHHPFTCMPKLLADTDRIHDQAHTLPICGYILESGKHPKSITWILPTYRQLIINTTFVKFHLPIFNPLCPTAHVKVGGLATKRRGSAAYCGKKMPWSVFLFTPAFVTFHSMYYFPGQFGFLVTYTSVHKTLLWNEQHKMQLRSVVILKQDTHYMDFVIWWPSLRTSQYHVHVLAETAQRACIRLSDPSNIYPNHLTSIVKYLMSLVVNGSLQMYDGPGSLSQSVTPYDLTLRYSRLSGYVEMAFCFTGNHGYLILDAGLYEMDIIHYTQRFLIPQTPCNSEYSQKQTYLIKPMFDQCYVEVKTKVSYIQYTIRQDRKNPDTIYEALGSTCQYGSLSVHHLRGGTQLEFYAESCHNAENILLLYGHSILTFSYFPPYSAAEMSWIITLYSHPHHIIKPLTCYQAEHRWFWELHAPPMFYH